MRVFHSANALSNLYKGSRVWFSQAGCEGSTGSLNPGKDGGKKACYQMYECPRPAVGADWSKVCSVHSLNTSCMSGEGVEMNKDARCHWAL